MRWLVTMAAAAALAVGCAPVTRVTLLPQADGSASSVIVTSKKGITRVSRPFDSAEIGPGKPKIQSLDARTVQQRYNRLLSVRPPPPERFTLYFESASSTHLTQKSHAVLIQIMQRLAYHPGGEIFITGDTDRASTADNDAPSLQRANIVRDMVIRHGIDPVRVHARGRGEHELAIQATDQVDEPGNRHVEVVVR